MGGVTLVCPDCTRGVAALSCSNCGYDGEDDALLMRLSAELHNRALCLLRDRRLREAWDTIGRSLQIYPFRVETLRLGLYVALEVGAFSHAQAWLAVLAPALDERELADVTASIHSDLATHNSMILGSHQFQLTDATRSWAALLRFLQSHDDAEKQSLRRILAARDSSFDHTIDAQGARARPMYIAVVVLLAAIVGLAAYTTASSKRMKHEIAVLTAQDTDRQAWADSVRASAARLRSLREEHFQMREHHRQDLLEALRRAAIATEWVTAENIMHILGPECSGFIAAWPDEARARLGRAMYGRRAYDLTLLAGETPYAIHARAMQIAATARRDGQKAIELKKAFVAMYPDAPCYTAPYLLDLSWAFSHRDPTQASVYATALLDYQSRHPDATVNSLVGALPKQSKKTGGSR